MKMSTAKATKRKLEFEEGPKALAKFKHTMKALFRVPKSDIQGSVPVSTSRHKPKKAGS
jgi:hypothetical protein